MWLPGVGSHHDRLIGNGYVIPRQEGWIVFNSESLYFQTGHVDVSKLAPVFNTSLFIGGLVLLVFVLGLGLNLHTNLGCVASAFGIYSCISCSLVGIFPMNNLSIHNVVAFSFFYGGLIAIILFNLIIIIDKQNKISKWLLIPGIITSVRFASFLITPYLVSSVYAHTLHSHHLVRSRVRLKPILEGSVLISISLMAKRPIGVEKMAGGESSESWRGDS